MKSQTRKKLSPTEEASLYSAVCLQWRIHMATQRDCSTLDHKQSCHNNIHKCLINCSVLLQITFHTNSFLVQISHPRDTVFNTWFNTVKVQNVKEIWNTDYKCHVCHTLIFIAKNHQIALCVRINVSNSYDFGLILLA